ncbi:hypothetical protein ACGF3J_22415 [Streptomyces sp. NPDC048171]|uniref:hypothetical protein n=1 Tax=unclassified Streptomyces TaxID=2593676 RepID=UPI0019294474|nr:hypothetical protein [Streptomyces sp. SID5789]
MSGIDADVEHGDLHALPDVAAGPGPRGDDLCGDVVQVGLDRGVEPDVRAPAAEGGVGTWIPDAVADRILPGDGTPERDVPRDAICLDA